MEEINENGNWQDTQDTLADESGLAIVLIDSEGLSALSCSNNNSICETLIASDQSSKCQPFCGSVFSNTNEKTGAVKYKCHAGLECVAVSVKTPGEKDLVAIVGRAFTAAKDYREATEKAVSGEWTKFPPTKFFENILLTNSAQNIEKLAKKISTIAEENKTQLADFDEKADADVEARNSAAEFTDAPAPGTGEERSSGEISGGTEIENTGELKLTRLIEEFSAQAKNAPSILADKAGRSKEDNEEFAAWHQFTSTIHDLDYSGACFAILKFIHERYDVASVAWLENADNHLQKVMAIGALETQNIRISVATDDDRLLRVFRRQSSIELRKQSGEQDEESKQDAIRLFPVAIRNEIRSALVLGEKVKNLRLRRHVSRFCQVIASELEIIRLRQELMRKSRHDSAFAKFNRSLTMVDTNDFWLSIMKTAAELVKAGRGSLLVYDEKGDNLVVRAAIGKKSELIEGAKSEIGIRIAKKVWKSGKPLLVSDVNKLGLAPAPPDWEYMTGSFISFPLSIGERRVGVLNVTDKTDGSSFGKTDLRLLRSISPQLAVAIDRATLKNKAGEFEQLSVTDPLTGLLNRRYLEERLTEEIKRSDRHGYPMSFLMIDVDDFKSYNDTYTHPEGDKALQLVGQGIRESLRDADVAARYGGEEFSILLPQTNLEEAKTIAERIRSKIASTQFPNRQVTVSVGLTGAASSRDTAEAIISAADKALFEAKRKGRNNVQVYEYVRKNLPIG
ncbi:MAG: diguanylate cyclase [Acidobacteria bacterium]|nr:diguanylate cyclase [Acidobacteriota bacterium]